MDTSYAIQYRTSYRGAYKDTKIPRDHLVQLLEAGLSAPSGCNMQTTSLIAVDDAALLCKIKALIEPPIAQTAPAFVCVLTQKIPARGNKYYNVQDYAAAIQNVLLCAVALGYQSCWYEGHITDADNIGAKIADALGVPKEYELVCVLPIGVAADEVKSLKSKKAFEERAWFNGFQNKSDRQ